MFALGFAAGAFAAYFAIKSYIKREFRRFW